MGDIRHPEATGLLNMFDRHVVWIAYAAWSVMVDQADVYTPLEAGGVLAGYWANPREAVVLAASGPGPFAVHETHRFAPDPDHQETWLADRYAQSSRVETYLGDWHTHPGVSVASLSWTDRATARRIASSPEARAPCPLTIILTGGASAWLPATWVGELVPVIGPWSRLRMAIAEVRLF